MKTKENLSFKALEDALLTLKEALSSPPKSLLERDGVIQRFEYSFEMTWKAIRNYLITMGRAEVSGSPKPLLRDALEEGLIDNIELWFGFLEARNASSHSYNKLTADQVFERAKEFMPKAEALLKKMRKKIAP